MAPGRAGRLRALLLEAVRGDADLLAPLGRLGSFRALAVLWESGWLGEGERSSARAAAAALRQRLRALGQTRRRIHEAATLPAGTAVLLEAAVAAIEPLCLDDGSGEQAFVPAPPPRWIGRPPPRQGDRVTLLGFVDPVIDGARSPRGPRQPPLRLDVRGTTLPVVAHLASRLASGKGGTSKIRSTG